MDIKKDTLSDFNRENNSNLADTGAESESLPEYHIPEYHINADNPFDKPWESEFLTDNESVNTENTHDDTGSIYSYAIVKRLALMKLLMT